jgi:murein DD-endopeptidase MepM/ murein hydrolase activator NlpD
LSSEFESPKTRPDGFERASFAALAALTVLVAGGAFLMSRGTRSEAPAGVKAEAAATAAAEAGGGAYGEVVFPAQPEKPVASSAGEVKAEAPAAVAALVPETQGPPPAAGRFGAPIRVKPQRAPVDREAELSGPLAPRLKPELATATAAAAAPSTAVLSLATRWLAGEEDRPSPVYFESDLAADRAAPPPLAVAYAKDLAGPPRELRVSLSKGETFVDALRRAGVRADDRNEAAFAFGKLYNLRQLRPGQSFNLTLAEPNKTLFELISMDEAPALHLVALDFNADPEKRVSLRRSAGGGYVADERAAPLTTRIAAVAGRIDGSLYLSAKRQGAPDEVIAGLAQMFAYDVDFQREIFGGDEFEAIFEVRYDETGKLVAGGDVLYGRLKWRGRQKEKGYYRFAVEEGGRGDYFDAKGESARRLLMKTPIDGARLSSGFGTRRHPILGYAKAHKGVDFAAPRGTPIMAAGDGVVERAGPYGSFGNYVSIRHAQGYKTAYAHMNSIRKGVRAGARVRQGDIIGTVGSTGRSTGPHLHYEVHFKNSAVNPQSLKIATGYELGGKDLARFRSERDRIDALRAGAEPGEKNLVADNAKNAAL